MNSNIFVVAVYIKLLVVEKEFMLTVFNKTSKYIYVYETIQLLLEIGL